MPKHIIQKINLTFGYNNQYNVEYLQIKSFVTFDVF